MPKLTGHSKRGKTGAERYAPQPSALDRERSDLVIMMRSLEAMWAVTATFFLIVLLTSRPPEGSEILLRSIDAIAFAVLGVQLIGGKRLPWWTPDLCAYLLYLVVGGIICGYRDPASPYAFFYLWPSVHAFYFLRWRRAAPQIAFIAVDYAVSLLAIPGRAFPTLRWAVTVVTCALICLFLALLRARVDALVDRLGGVARTDPLTGLRNRRAYDEILQLEIARAGLTGQSLALVIADLDHFKMVNDEYGHPVGDDVLQRVAAELDRSARRVDVTIRLGGEEFALILPNTDDQGAYLVAERLRHNIRQAFAGRPVGVTMSFGIAAYPDDGTDAETLFRAADTALLEAKALGRDRAVVCSAGPRRSG